MSALVATGTAVPPHEYGQSEVLEYVESWLGPERNRFRRVLDAFEHGLVARRRSILPIEEVFAPRSFERKNHDYMRGVVELGERAVRTCLERAGVEPGAVDFFISTSCTGFMIPSLDAVLAHRLGMKAALGRLPITQHGCAGGAVALRQAHEHLQAHPSHKVLVLAAEIPSVTFQTGDKTPENIISTVLFGDGAAAVLLAREAEPAAPRILGCDSRMFPDSLDLMGFELRDSGLKIVLSKKVPEAVRRHAPGAVEGFLHRWGLEIDDLAHFLIHPGGRKIIEGFERVFGLGEGALRTTREVLQHCGNLSSATVLFILDHYFRARIGRRGDLGLLLAFGPGFGCESVLLEWGVPATGGRPRRVQAPAWEDA